MSSLLRAPKMDFFLHRSPSGFSRSNKKEWHLKLFIDGEVR